MACGPPASGLGEGEAISLALDARADLLLIDERAGREAAEVRQLAIAGTLAILLKAGLRGYLDFPDALNRLCEFGFRVSPRLAILMLDRFDQAIQKP